jgi:hypothetical protein
LSPPLYEECFFRQKINSVTSLTVQRAYIWGGVIPPPSDSGRRGGKPQPPPGAGQCPSLHRTSSCRLRVSVAFLHDKASGPTNYQAPATKRNTHGEGSVQLPRTENKSRPRPLEIPAATGALWLGPPLYEECSVRQNVSSVTSVTVHRAQNGGGVIPPPSARGRRGGKPQPPPGAGQCLSLHRTSSDRLRVSVAFLHDKASGPTNYHARRGKRATTTHRNY